MNLLWVAIKRNPVINFFIAAVITQFSQDYIAGDIDWPHFSSYAATLCFGIAARLFTVPSSEHEETIDKLNLALHSKGVKAIDDSSESY
jgi:hypothetical protein